MQKIISWVSPLSSRTRHIDVLESVQPGTGSWLFDRDTFGSWAKSEISVLWCPGIRKLTYSQECVYTKHYSTAGAGKTRLALVFF